MSKLFFDCHDSFLDSRTDHSLGSLPDSEIFDLLEEFYAAEGPGSLEPYSFEENAPLLSQEEARLCDMIIDRMEAGGGGIRRLRCCWFRCMPAAFRKAED